MRRGHVQPSTATIPATWSVVLLDGAVIEILDVPGN